MMTVAPVTVGLPVYNGEPYLADAIHSILAQTHYDLCLVISDNGSTDGTEEICREATSDPRVVYERQDENRGAAWNYNRTVALARSPFFKWAAADDLLAPTCVERCYETLAGAPPSVVMVYPRTVLVDASANPVGEWNDGLEARSGRPHTRFNRVVRNVVLGNGIFGLMRSDALGLTRGHGNYPSADWVFLSELALLGEIWELPEPLFFRRMHDLTSRRANTDLDQLSAWFDPAASPETNEKRRLRREYLAAIRHADLRPRDRLLTRAEFAVVWSRRHSRWYKWLAVGSGR
jgi:glycosyltransferase involved in cell wall biosynthesis